MIILFLLLFAILNAHIAGKKGRSKFGWALAGFFFGMFGTLVLVLLPDLNGLPFGLTKSDIVRAIAAANREQKAMVDAANNKPAT